MKAGASGGMLKYHFGLGMWLRNRWGLWLGSRLAAFFYSYGVTHPDGMSCIILSRFWLHIHDQPIAEVKEHPEEVQRLRKEMEK